jgi:hypothetical protein
VNRVAITLLLFLSPPAFAAERPIPFAELPNPMPLNDAQGRAVDAIHVPPRSPVSFSGWSKDPNSNPVAQFEGARFLLTGTYYYGDNERDKGREFSGSAYIIPDRNAQLPQLTKRVGSRAIVIDNPDRFADAVIPASVLRSVRSKGGGYASGRVAIRVDGFTVGIACDAPSYVTHFVSVFTPSGATVAKARPPIGGC